MYVKCIFSYLALKVREIKNIIIKLKKYTKIHVFFIEKIINDLVI